MSEDPRDEVIKQAGSTKRSKAKNIGIIAFIILFVAINAIIIQVVGNKQKNKNMVKHELPADLRQGKELIQVQNCLNCHRFDDRVIGPSFAEIAQRYNYDMNQVMPLSKKVKSGGGGEWGAVRMPPHAHLSDLQIQLMVAWILQYEGAEKAQDNEQEPEKEQN